MQSFPKIGKEVVRMKPKSGCQHSFSLKIKLIDREKKSRLLQEVHVPLLFIDQVTSSKKECRQPPPNISRALGFHTFLLYANHTSATSAVNGFAITTGTIATLWGLHPPPPQSSYPPPPHPTAALKDKSRQCTTGWGNCKAHDRVRQQQWELGGWGCSAVPSSAGSHWHQTNSSRIQWMVTPCCHHPTITGWVED